MLPFLALAIPEQGPKMEAQYLLSPVPTRESCVMVGREQSGCVSIVAVVRVS